MSEVQHTPEPWQIGKFDRLLDSTGKKDVIVYGLSIGGGKEPEANARRIVAAVNALQGATTEELEEAVRLGITDVSMGNLFSSRLKLTRERDEARAMVQTLIDELDKIGTYTMTSTDIYGLDVLKLVELAKAKVMS